MLREFNRDVLSRLWVAVLLTLLAGLMTFAMITGDRVPLWQALVLSVVDVTVIVAALYAWSHRSSFIYEVLHSTRSAPPPETDLLTELLAATPATRPSTGTTALEIPALIAVNQVVPAQSDVNTVDIVDDAAATDLHPQHDGHHDVDGDGVDD